MDNIVYCPPNVDCPCYVRLVADNERLRAGLEQVCALINKGHYEAAFAAARAAIRALKDKA